VAIPVTVRAIRRLEIRVRRLAGDWCGAAIGDPYQPEPARREGQPPSFWARFGFLIADPATWRDLVWITVDTLVGWLLALTPAALIAWGLFGIVMPAVCHPIVTAHGNNWYAFIHVTTASTAWLSAALGIAFIALGLLTAPVAAAPLRRPRAVAARPHPDRLTPKQSGWRSKTFLRGRLRGGVRLPRPERRGEADHGVHGAAA